LRRSYNTICKREIGNAQHIFRSGAIVGNAKRSILVAPRGQKWAGKRLPTEAE